MLEADPAIDMNRGMSTITLLTDFGVSSPYIAQMKGVLVARVPNVRLIDLTHSVAPQRVLAGAITLLDLAPWFPPGTIHIGVVDPGVGTERRILAASVGDWHFVLPDNGLLSPIAERFNVHQIVSLNKPEFWLPSVSNTFHGRDIMAPVAAAIANGIPLEQLGEPVSNLKKVVLPEPTVEAGITRGEVLYVDSFGNLVTNIMAEQVECGATFTIGGQRVSGLVSSYGNRNPGELIALIGSSSRLEFAIVDDNAAERLGTAVGADVVVSPSSPSR